MPSKLTITCPECKKEAIVSCYEDPAVGINFDFDVLEGSACTCDADDEAVYLQQYEKASDAYWSQFTIDPEFEDEFI